MMGPSSSALLITLPRFPSVKMVFRLRREGLEKKRGEPPSRTTPWRKWIPCPSPGQGPSFLPSPPSGHAGQPQTRARRGADWGGGRTACKPLLAAGPVAPSPGVPPGKDILLAGVFHPHQVVLLSHLLVLQVRETENGVELATTERCRRRRRGPCILDGGEGRPGSSPGASSSGWCRT